MKKQILSEQFRKMQKLAGIKLNETYENNELPMEPEQVKPGMVGEDYNGIKGKVIKIVPIADWESLKKYDETGWMTQDEIDNFNSEGDYTHVVAVEEMEQHPGQSYNQDTVVYTYGGGGFEVYANQENKDENNIDLYPGNMGSEESAPRESMLESLPKRMKKGQLKEVIKKEIKRILKEDLDTLNMGNTEKVEEIIKMLKGVDGETMEYIIRQVGMEDQMLHQLGGIDMDLDEAKKKEEKPISDKEEAANRKEWDERYSDEEVEDVPQDNEGGDVKAIQDALQTAYDKAKLLGDDKLLHQIGNTVTMFVKTHVVNQEAPVNENKRRRK